MRRWTSQNLILLAALAVVVLCCFGGRAQAGMIYLDESNPDQTSLLAMSRHNSGDETREQPTMSATNPTAAEWSAPSDEDEVGTFPANRSDLTRLKSEGRSARRGQDSPRAGRDSTKTFANGLTLSLRAGPTVRLTCLSNSLVPSSTSSSLFRPPR